MLSQRSWYVNPIVMRNLQRFGESGEMTVGKKGKAPTDSNGVFGMCGNLLYSSKHDAAMQSTCEGVVSTRGVGHSNSASKFAHVDGESSRIGYDPRDHSPIQPRCGRSEYWQPEHLDVRVVHCKAFLVNDGVDPRNNS